MKSCLAAGAFESLVRAADFEQIICVGNMVAVLQQLAELGIDDVARAEVVFDYCDGAFSDFSWFRRSVRYIADPHRRVGHMDLTDDWWYADDLASYFFELENKVQTFDEEFHRRVYVPRANGDGQGLARWLGRIGSNSI